MIDTALHRAARLCGLVGGVLAIAVAGLVVWSVVGRAFFARPVPGDVELTQLGIALSISLCLPWAQLQRANIIVDFFTQRAGPGLVRRLDGLGSLLLAVMVALLAWRTSIGAVSVYQSNESSAILELPGWIVYAGLAPGLALTALVAVWQAIGQWRGRSPSTDVVGGRL